ncbi:MAG: WD40 repeat domain-containing protein [Cryomorphaceae bacterium]|nr:WD40 repeat domain-containing protein [Cryomorphaceae bacterium]
MPRQNTTISVSAKPLKALWSADLEDYVNDIAFSPDAARLVTAAANSKVTIFDTQTGQEIYSHNSHELGALVAEWSYDGTFLATAGQDGKVRILHGETFQLLTELDHGADWVEHLTWAPAQRKLLTGAGKTARLWNLDDLSVEEFPKHESTITGVQWVPGSKDSFATACYGGVRFWQIGKSEPKRHLKWKGSLLNLCFSPGGKVVACGCQDGAVHFWTLPNGVDLEMSGYPTKVRELAWDYQGRYLATGGSDQPTIWDFSGKGPEGSKPTMLSGHESFVSFLSYQPRGTVLASGGFDGRVFLWNPPKQKAPAGHASLNSPVSKLRWSPDGKVLVSGLATGEIHLWSIP